MGAGKKLRKQRALAEIERLTQIARATAAVNAAVTGARLSKAAGRGAMAPGEAQERDDIARVLMKSDSKELRDAAMARQIALDGLAGALDESHRVITKSGRSR